MALFANRFTGQGLYLLDEPEAALSAQKQMTFLSIMHNYVRLGSQFVIATHSPILLAYPEAQIFLLDSEGIHLRKYEETDNYQITRNFLNRTPQMLKILMDNEEGQSSC
jgi:predicted ATPase